MANRCARWSPLCLAFLFAPSLSWAGPGSVPLVGGLQAVIDLLRGPLGIVIVALLIAAAGIRFARRCDDAMDSITGVLIGAALLFGCVYISGFLASVFG